MLTQEQIAKLEQDITTAIDQHLADGGELIYGNFGHTKGRCPIACLAAGRPEGSWAFAISDKVGFVVSDTEMWSFIQGFDKRVMFSGANPDLYQLGKKLRQKYLP